MTDPVQTPPAGTPPANDPNGGQKPPATPPANDPGKTLTQAEVDAIVEDRLARDRAAREKDLGVSLKDAKALIAAAKKAEDDKKTELEKLAGERDALKKSLAERDLNDLKRSKVELLVSGNKIKLPEGTTIADVLDLVTGADEAGVDSSLLKLAKLFPPTPNAAQGAGNPGVPGAPPAAKIWKESEIRELRLSGGLTEAILADIKKAAAEGRVQ